MRTQSPVAAGLAVVSLAIAFPAAGQDIQVYVNGQPVAFTGAHPMEIEGRTMVPLRGVLEQLRATVVWNPTTRTVIGSRGEDRFALPVGSSSATVNGRPAALDVPAQIVAGTTMVPLRFVSEALGADVRWHAATQTVEISTDQYFPGRPGSSQTRIGAAGAASQPMQTDRRRQLGAAAATRFGAAEAAPPSSGAGAGIGRRLNTPTALASPSPPVIQSFTHSASGPLKSGAALGVELDGTPGGSASFDVLGVASSIPMKESQPGHYVGRWTVPAGLSVQNARVFGHLAVAGSRAPIVQAGTPLTIDARPPQVVSLSPAPGSTVTSARPEIYAEFRGQGTSGIDPNSIHLLVNGRDVTPQAQVTPSFIFYRPNNDLTGATRVSLRVADKAGNVQTAASTFAVRAEPEGIASVSVNADKPLAPGDTLTVTARAPAGGKAVFDLPGVAQGVPMPETSPGVYTGSYTVRAQDKAYNIPVAVRFISASGSSARAASARPVSLAGGRLTPPVILEPKSGEGVGGSVTVTGRADPGATVRIKLSTSGRLFGVLPVQGGDIVQEVRAAPDGTFKSDALPLSSPPGARDLRYRVEAVTVDPLGRTSPATAVQFQNR